MATIVFSNQKGGPGKTTLAVLYAQWLVDRLGQRVAFVDLDAQCNASGSLRRFADCKEADAGAARLFEDPVSVAEAEVNALMLYAGSRAMSDLERAAAQAILPVFRRNVARIAGAFDHVVIDTPPALGLRMSAALMAATDVVCPIELEAYSVDCVTDMLKTVFGIRRRYNPELRLAGLIVNRVNPLSQRQKASLGQLLREYADFVVPAKVSTRTAIPEALAEGMALWRMPKSAARDASSEVLRMFELLHRRVRACRPASAASPGSTPATEPMALS